MGWGDTSTAGDPGEQSAADASQSASVDSATAGSNAGSIGGVGGGNDGNGTGTMDPGQMQAAGLNAGYGFAAQDAYNTAHGITATNPYGKQGFFSRVFGIDPSKIDYSGNMDLNTRMGIANNQFSKYANPQNKPGMLGYNPDFPTAKEGELRAGAQSAGFKTKFGDVMEQARQQSTSEMIARGLMSLTPLGPIVGMLDTQEYGLPGQPGFESFDPNNPRAGGGILSAMLGGLNPTQAKEALVGAFAPVAPAPTPTQIGSVTPSQYETRADIIARTSQHPLTGETTGSLFSSRPQSLPATGTPTGVGMTVNTEFGPMSVPESTMSVAGYNELSPVEKMAVQSAIQETKPQASVETQQLAGSFFDSLFRDPMISPEAREILKEKGMTIDDLFAPKTPTPEPEKPDIMDLIQGATQTSALGGPATANQYADLSGLFSQGMAAVGDIVSIPGGYMDTRTGKQYSGRYNPSTSGRTYTGTQRPSGVAPFSGAALRQGLANLWGS